MATTHAVVHLDADALAARLLATSRTRLGGLNIDHSRRVAAALGDAASHLVAAALLHDVLEKGDVATEDFVDLVRDERIRELVHTLTKLDDEPEDEYLRRCASDPVAFRIKRLDLLDKLLTTDIHVPVDVADEVRAEVRARLHRLDQLADEHTGATTPRPRLADAG